MGEKEQIKSGLSILLRGYVNSDDPRVVKGKRSVATLNNQRFFDTKNKREKMKNENINRNINNK